MRKRLKKKLHKKDYLAIVVKESSKRIKVIGEQWLQQVRKIYA